MRVKSHVVVWLVVFLAFVATGLSFLDRQVLSVSIIEIQQEFAITDTEYGLINTGFLISYALMFTLGGILIDRFGSRLGLAVSVGFWSMATMMHSLASNAYHFMTYRFLLGLGEGGAFPGAVRAVVEWVPKSWQALANGIAIGGAALGAVIAPPLTVYLMGVAGWRGVFIITGLIGIIWVGIWLYVTRNQGKNISQTGSTKIDQKNISWKEISRLLLISDVWVFILIRFLLDPIFYFYMFWIPKYLSEVRNIELAQIGNLFWIPFLALGISNIWGGYLSDTIYRKTKNINLARKSIMGVAAFMTVSAVGIQYLQSIGWVIMMLFIAFFAHGFWITNYVTSISDIFGKKYTSTIIGLSGSAGALSSLVINPLIGTIISNYTYQPLWIYAGVMYSIAFVFFIVAIPKIQLRKEYV